MVTVPALVLAVTVYGPPAVLFAFTVIIALPREFFVAVFTDWKSDTGALRTAR